MADPTIPIAFGAGVVSFLSPCVLPLVPGYVSYMSGMTAGADDMSPRVKTIRATVASLVFVAGFTLVFVPLGATATLLGQALRSYQDEFRIASGIFIILLGLVFMGVIKIRFLQQEARFHPKPGAGLWGAAVLGGAFAFGWSPCIGPILGSVLTLAAGRQGSALEGAVLLGSYSLGLGVPFILAGLGVTRLTGVVGWLRRHTRRVSLVSGVLLTIVGVLFVTDQLFRSRSGCRKPSRPRPGLPSPHLTPTPSESRGGYRLLAQRCSSRKEQRASAQRIRSTESPRQEYRTWYRLLSQRQSLVKSSACDRVVHR